MPHDEAPPSPVVPSVAPGGTGGKDGHPDARGPTAPAASSSPTGPGEPADRSDFTDLPSLVARHAAARPGATAVVVGEVCITWQGLDGLSSRVAAALQRDGLRPCEVVAVCAGASIAYLALFVGALRAGLAVAPLAPSATPAQLLGMAGDAGARCLFVDAEVAAVLDRANAATGLPRLPALRRLRLDDSSAALARAGEPGGASGTAATGRTETDTDTDTNFTAWLSTAPAPPEPVAVQPEWPFNLIYSSGTTGTPKGIVQPHAMRWAHIRRAQHSGYAADTVMLCATPLYSNTTLVAVVPTLAYGGCVVLMPKFDAGAYLALAEKHRATHTMLVPVQYRRLMARPDFGQFDLSAFRTKLCTSAHFPPELKADVLARWPGGLVEIYGMTEGGGTCMLYAHLHPHKLHTVGQPVDGHDIRLVDEHGTELPRTPGQASAAGEVVGRSPGMMSGYHHQPALTAEAEWHNAQGQRFIRTGDIARFDEDGFLVLLDRRKDMVISGGFNIYPSDLEAVLRRHPAVADVAVFGVPSTEWGETPVAVVVCRPSNATAPEDLRSWANAQLGKTQRLAALRYAAASAPGKDAELPRNGIGKVLKRELRAAWLASV